MQYGFLLLAGLIRWGLALGLALGVGVSLAADRDTVRVAVQLEPPILDPTAGAAAPIAEVVSGNVYEGLVQIGDDGEPRPALAQSWQVSDDGLTYTFALRQGVHFHDGTPFDAEAVRFSLERARAEGSLNPMKAALASVARVEVLSTWRVRIVLSRPAGSLLQTLGGSALAMVSPASAQGNRVHPVGTGPFRFVEWRRGASLSFARFEGYWGHQAAIERVVFKFIGDPTAAYAAMMAGDIDLFSNYPAPENLAQFQHDKRFVVHVGSSEGETILAINQRTGPLSQLLVRRAISHALDRRALIDGAMYGFGEPIGSHFPPGQAAYVDLTGRYPYDVAAARQLLVQAGYPDGLDLVMKLPPTPYARRCGEIIAAQLQQVGIRVRIHNIEWSQWMDQVFTRHDFDLTVVNHAEPFDYDIYGRDDYYFGYHSPVYQSLLKQLDERSAPSERKVILQAMQRQLSDDAVNGFLFQYPSLIVGNAHLRGLRAHNVGGAIPLNLLSYDDAVTVGTNLPNEVRPGSGLLFTVLEATGCALAAGLVVLVMSRCSLPWLARRVLALAGTALVASLLVFALVQLAPGDPARFILGLQADADVVGRLRHELGLDASAWHRYLSWMSGLIQGDLGRSYTYQVPVSQLIAERTQVSLPLAVYALLLSTALALPAGLVMAHRRTGWASGVLMVITQLGVAVPNFWLGLLLTLVFAIGLQWVPAGGFAGWGAGVLPALGSLTLPALALAMPQAAILARVLQTALQGTLQEDYVRTARAKGLGRWPVLCRHALPNALVPVLTILGMQFSFLLAGAIIIENVFFLPGLGRLLFQGVVQHDLILVQGLVLLLALVVAVVSFGVDVAYHVVDPRLARGGVR